MTTLRITEIFFSIQGESTTTGLPTTFIRLTGCPLRCTYCDTEYAFKGGQHIPISEIITKTKANHSPYVCITGGEPLAQPNVHQLITELCDLDFQVSIETSGAIKINNIDQRATIVMDLKTPNSGEEKKNIYENIDYLKPKDQIKFVICSRSDYDWAQEIMAKYDLTNLTEVLFSASFDELNPTTLANWIIADKLPVRFQLQLHKILWNDAKGH